MTGRDAVQRLGRIDDRQFAGKPFLRGSAAPLDDMPRVFRVVEESVWFRLSDIHRCANHVAGLADNPASRIRLTAGLYGVYFGASACGFVALYKGLCGLVKPVKGIPPIRGDNGVHVVYHTPSVRFMTKQGDGGPAEG